MRVVEDFESRPHKAVSFVVEREKEIQEWNERKLPKVLPGYSGGRLPGRDTKERGREEGEEDEGGEERRIRNQIIKEVIAGIQKKAINEGAKKSKRIRWQSLMRSWDCSPIENGEQDKMAAQWDEEQKLEEILERRRM